MSRSVGCDFGIGGDAGLCEAVADDGEKRLLAVGVTGQGAAVFRGFDQGAEWIARREVAGFEDDRDARWIVLDLAQHHHRTLAGVADADDAFVVEERGGLGLDCEPARILVDLVAVEDDDIAITGEASGERLRDLAHETAVGAIGEEDAFGGVGTSEVAGDLVSLERGHCAAVGPSSSAATMVSRIVSASDFAARSAASVAAAVSARTCETTS